MTVTDSLVDRVDVSCDSGILTKVEFSDFEIREIHQADFGPATIHRPSSGNSKGEIFLLPGWSGPRTGPAEVLVFLASELARRGWTAVRLDLPGRGDAPDPANHLVDLDAMIVSATNSLVCCPSESKHSQRAFLGMCSGGNVGLGALQYNNCGFQHVIAISTFPFQPARTKTFDKRRRWKNIKNYAAKALSPSTWMRLFRGEINTGRVMKNVSSEEKKTGGERNLKDSARDIEKELLSWKGSALFVWGGGDEEAPPARAHFEKLHERGFGEKNRVSFHTVPGANHNFYGKAWRSELLEKIVAFLESGSQER